MTDLQKFDPSTLMDGVKQRIKATFVSLIPDEHWEQLCKKEVDSFFDEDKRQNADYYRFSNFQKVCNEILIEMSKEKIKQYIEPYVNQQWTDDGEKCGELLKKFLAEHASEIFAKTFGNMFQNAVNNMKRY